MAVQAVGRRGEAGFEAHLFPTFRRPRPLVEGGFVGCRWVSLPFKIIVLQAKDGKTWRFPRFIRSEHLM